MVRILLQTIVVLLLFFPLSSQATQAETRGSLSKNENENTVHHLSFKKGTTTLKQRIEISSSQKLILIVGNDKKNCHKIKYKLSKYIGDPLHSSPSDTLEIIYKNEQLPPGQVEGMKFDVSPGYYIIEMSCPTSDCSGFGKVILLKI
jgi:hypothetical protein